MKKRAKPGEPWVRPVEAKPYRRVMEKIGSMIEAGLLAPGDCLLSERELVEKLEVSRNSVREALKALEALGLIEVVPGQGAFVKKPSSDDFEILATILMVQNRNLRHIIDARRVVEIGAMELACRHRCEEDLQKLGWILRSMEEATALDLRCRADLDFHVAAVEAAHNPLLSRIMRVLSSALQDQMPVILRKLYRTPEDVSRILREHWRIYRALENRAEAEAKAEVEAHLGELSAIVDEE